MRVLHGRITVVALALATVSWFLGTAPSLARAATPGATADTVSAESSDRLMGLSLEELANVKVSSVSKREEPWFQAPAAVYVITSADIERSGARSIPEILRLVPGMEVSRIDADKWAVSARGFNDRFAMKLLVLVDGHSVYTQLFSGVFWDAQETTVDDIERIEVIRGPGATLWGANSINGVINIITKDSQESGGALVRASSGSVERGYVAGSVGGDLGVRSTFRLFALGFQRDVYPDLLDGAHDGDWRAGRAGLRVDWNPDAKTHVTFSGSLQKQRAVQALSMASLAPPYATHTRDHVRHEGQTAMSRWTRTFNPRSEATLQLNYDHSDRHEGLAHWRQHTLDVDLQQSFVLNANHETIVGASYRMYQDDIEASSIATFPEPTCLEHFGGAFVHHEIHPASRRAALVLGTSVEKADFARGNIQPSARAWVMPTTSQVVWAGASRAVRTPSRGERGSETVLGAFPDASGSGLTIEPTMIGSNSLPDEMLTALEAGYRVHVGARLTMDVTIYRNHYTSLRSVRYGAPVVAFRDGVPYLKLPLLVGGDEENTGRGSEVSLWLDPASHWRLRAGYTYARMEHEAAGTSLVAGYPPRNSAWLHSLLDLDRHWSLDGTLRYKDALPTTPVPAFTEMDARLAWHPTSAVEVALLGENLLHDSHVEFCQDLWYDAAKIERSVGISVRFRR
jgi:iron complex outermembrane recepter protein